MDDKHSSLENGIYYWKYKYDTLVHLSQWSDLSYIDLDQNIYNQTNTAAAFSSNSF